MKTVKLMVYVGRSKYPGPCRNCSRYCGCDTLRLFRDDRYKAAKWVPICTDCCEEWEQRFTQKIATPVVTAPVVVTAKAIEVKPAVPVQLSLFGGGQ